MKLQNQVCSVEQAKRLKELGVNEKTFFSWELNYEPEPRLVVSVDWNEINHLSAYTVAEFGIMLPHPDNLTVLGGFVYMSQCDISSNDGMPWYCIWEYDTDKEERGMRREIISGKTEAEARAAMLIYLLEYNIITAEEVNEHLKAA